MRLHRIPRRATPIPSVYDVPVATSIACPNCGAPAQVMPGQGVGSCTFCGRSFQVDAPAPPPSPFAPPPPPPQPFGPPPIIVVPPAGLYEPSITNTSSFVGLRLLLGIVPAVMALAIAGFVTFSVNRSTGAPSALGFGWNGSTPLVCGGNENITVNDVTASFSGGSAINAGGNCHVNCVGCNLSAPVVIAAGGNAEITLVNSKVTGAQAVVAGGNAQVKIVGNSTVTGQIVKGGNAEVVTPQSFAVPSPVPAPPTPTSAPSHAAPNHGPSKPR